MEGVAARSNPQAGKAELPARTYQAGRPTAAELERRKARVMDVATDLFVQHGYAATSLVDIAKGAGVATRTLYQHFGDKEALFRDVVFARNSGAIVPAPAVKDDDTLNSALLRTAQYCCEVAYKQKSIDLMRLMVAESNRFPDLMKSVATAAFRHFRRNITRMFEGAAALKLIPQGDHAGSAALFSDLVLGNTPIMTYTDWQTARPTTEDMEIKVDLFILGRFGPAVAETAKTKAGRRR